MLPISIVLITLNEAHNLKSIIPCLTSSFNQVVVVDSFSTDGTIDYLSNTSVDFYQRTFHNFSDQWNWAISHTNISQPWTMKLDPDERLTPNLLNDISNHIKTRPNQALAFRRRLWFMQKPLNYYDNVLRLWPSGHCHFSNVLVNEHPIVSVPIVTSMSHLDHLDSPNLFHWVAKQNTYTDMEASALLSPIVQLNNCKSLAYTLKMALKRNFFKIPGFYLLLFVYLYVFKCVFLSGYVGFSWCLMRVYVYKLRELKYREKLYLSL